MLEQEFIGRKVMFLPALKVTAAQVLAGLACIFGYRLLV